MQSIFSIVVVTAIAILFLTMLIIQSRHRTQLARKKKRHSLNLQIKKLQSFLETLPESYWHPEVKDFIFQTLIHAIQQSIELKKHEQTYLKSDLELYKKQRDHYKSFASNEFANAGNIELNKANLFNNILKTLHKFVQDNYELKRITHNDAEKFIEAIEIKLIEANCDFYSTRGQWYLNNDQHRESRNLFQKAYDCLQNSKYSDRYKQQCITLEHKIEAIQISWREHNAENQSNRKNLLNRDFDEWDEENKWQQKQDYD